MDSFNPTDPAAPLFLKNGGYNGKIKRSLEELMFRDYTTVYNLKKWAEAKLPEDSAFRWHINWLFEKGKNIRPIRYCKIDGCLNFVKFFSVRFSGSQTSIDRIYMCCDKDECKEKLKFPGNCSLYEIKFDVHILNFSAPDLKKIYDLFSYACGVKIEKLSPFCALEFFKNCPSEQTEIPKIIRREKQLAFTF